MAEQLKPATVDPLHTPQAEAAKPDGGAKVKVKVLKWVGPHAPGDVIEVSEEEAAQLTSVGEVHDGVSPVVHQRAMRLDDYDKLDSKETDTSKMTMKDLADRHMQNVVETPSEFATKDQSKAALAEKLNLDGVPVSSGAPFVATGGITPPTTVIPALAKASKRPHVSADDLFAADKQKEASEDKKEKAPEDKKSEKAPEPKDVKKK